MNLHFAAAAVVLLASVDSAFAGASAVAVPDTPAGHTLRAWLTAFNSGDRAKMATYCEQYDSNDSPDQMLSFYRHTGGVDLIAVDKSERLHVEFRLQDRGTPTVGLGKLDVEDKQPARVVGFSLRSMPPGMSVAAMNVTVDAATRGRILDGIVARLAEWYVYPDVAQKMADAVRAHQKKGDYDGFTDGDALSGKLTEHLRAVSHDKHLRVACVPEVLPKDNPPGDPPIDAAMRAHMEADNCGFERVERLASNIGYIKFNFFGPPAVCGPTATAAFGFLAHVDAIIFDLRGNGGGNPDMVAFMASYLFAERTRLNDIYERKQNKTTEQWTNPAVPGPKLVGKPAFVLTAKRTFSGAEDFSYALKNLKRATIIGETTGGGAHPTRPVRLDDHFLLGVPFARSVNTITKTDWEGTGVVPDVKVPADDALTVALKLAGEQLAKKRPRP